MSSSTIKSVCYVCNTTIEFLHGGVYQVEGNLFCYSCIALAIKYTYLFDNQKLSKIEDNTKKILDYIENINSKNKI